MLTYKLCKQLQKAGFPQKHREVGETIPYSPTLAELIKKCGKNVVLWHYDKKWRCGLVDSECGESGEDYVDSYPSPLSMGSSPEVAVTKLYLKLNENRTKKI